MIIILTNYLNLVTIYHVSGDSVQKFAIDARDASVAKTNAFAIVADARSSQTRDRRHVISLYINWQK